MKKDEKPDSQQTVCWPDREGRRRLLCLIFFCVCVCVCEDGYIILYEEEDVGSGFRGCVRSLQQCNILIYLYQK